MIEPYLDLNVMIAFVLGTIAGIVATFAGR